MHVGAQPVGGRTTKRRRGVFLSQAGRQRYHEAQRRHEDTSRGGARRSIEDISFDVGLSTKTVSRVLNREVPVDLRTVELLFASVGIALDDGDYVRAQCGDEPTQLPQRRSAFFGRSEQLCRLRLLLVEKRAISLVGTGGVGKTRLAIEAASRFGHELFDRVAYCDLAVVTDAALVAATVAPALAQSGDTDRILLLIDNCEHVLASVAHVADGLLRLLPCLVVLATSREPIGLEGEAVLRVPPLPVPAPNPPSVTAALTHPAVALFVNRAREVDDGFVFDEAALSPTLEIVSRVEAIPLALELAASRVATSALREISQSLREHLSALGTESTCYGARHRSVRALVDWSYDLLDDEERRVFRCLAVFTGSFDVAAAERVCGSSPHRDAANLIAQLARKSLLFVEHDMSPTRYRMLETIRQDAALRLRECPDAIATKLRHARYFNELLASGEAASAGTGQRAQFARISAELDNVREALEWSASTSANPGIAAGLCCNLRAFWDNRGDFVEGEMWLRRVLACDLQSCSAATRAQLHEGLSLMLYRQGRLEVAISEANIAQRICAENGYAPGRMGAQNLIGIVALDGGDIIFARAVFERNLRDAQMLGDDAQTSVALNNLGRVLAGRDDTLESALEHFARGLAHARAIGLSAMVVTSLANLAKASAAIGRLDDAIAFARRGIDEARAIENRAAHALLAVAIAIYRLRLEGFPAATGEIAAALEELRHHPQRSDLRNELIALADALLDAGQAQRAALLAGAIATFHIGAGWRSHGDGERHRDTLETRVRATLGSEIYAALHLRGMTYAIDEALEQATGTL